VRSAKVDAPASATAVAKQAQAKVDAKTQKLLDKQFEHGQRVAQMRQARAAGYAAGGS
jgi:hypothetical protein